MASQMRAGFQHRLTNDCTSPGGAAEALIKKLEDDDFVSRTGETVKIHATGGPPAPKPQRREQIDNIVEAVLRMVPGSVRTDVLGRSFMVDLLSLDDDELDRITCLRTSCVCRKLDSAILMVKAAKDRS